MTTSADSTPCSSVDVGPSYGLATVAAVLPVKPCEDPRAGNARQGVVAAVVVHRAFTDAGHLLAALIGAAIAQTAAEGRRRQVAANSREAVAAAGFRRPKAP